MMMETRLLVADSDLDLANIYQRFFTGHGYQVRFTADGLDCVLKLRDTRPDVLVLDWQIPWGGGDGVLAEMRDDPPLRSIPVILIATDVCDDEMWELVESRLGDDLNYLPVTDCFRKPFRMRDLAETIQFALHPQQLAADTVQQSLC